MSKAVRAASHAGSWYQANGPKLDKQLGDWLANVNKINENVKAIISPHAGYTYSGRAASHGFINLIPDKFKRIFILGPSHHVYMKNCGLTKMDTFETPIGNLKVDRAILNQLYETGEFSWIDKSVDEDEHSLEMQLPYLSKLIGNKDISIVPVMVGSIGKGNEEKYGAIFAKYFDDPENFFVISSDFCHWGQRFDYTRYNKEDGPIHKSIEVLDKQGMKIIESGNPLEFSKYLSETKNTICGRNPISVMLWTAQLSKTKCKIDSIYYEQSSQCVHSHDSSVSYGVLAFTKL
ncbi:hypothetical protein DLAC_04559 [Tieghemostelium lacteum]|uniref:Uncharacterized protein n=1 Tax=Tieghemostelium lacteum TaxID=361077 RepID=A0A151ZJT2_TIELA|nr:hypothetical protein DLAC_04559 [Tieghemostelium lacteum]|eukprot:KYQ94261.1 hypothetical protein DLAC_04559 [Tieghemostelium lacteum]